MSDGSVSKEGPDETAEQPHCRCGRKMWYIDSGEGFHLCPDCDTSDESYREQLERITVDPKPCHGELTLGSVRSEQ